MTFPENYFIIFILAIVSFILSYFGASVGLVLGNIRLPLLVYALQASTSSIGIATGTNLATSAMGSIAGTYCHIREGRVNFRLLWAIGIPSGLGAFISMLTFARMEAYWAKILIGIILIYSSFQIAKNQKTNLVGKQHSTQQSLLLEVAIGVVLGLLSGAVGLALGSMRLPAMIRVLGIDPKDAVGTNLAINLITASIGAVTSILTLGVHLPLLLFLVPATILGSYLGARSVKKIDTSKLRKLIAWALAATGTFMIVESLH
ncbi:MULTISPECIES: sulfite exporter TauE/SafE family protein [Nostocales]|uniref:Probable membrane transporter protein n=3 Tax=Nostocales TaxID=1161 RepID=A0A8S9T103_9CYAN|nr:sulfite exporter TauE/SafE family protein [Tolypothrix bouteillei]KAF3885384.1 sulfite exporter TauE/SafE family protein [Tolypothrix bouteillei VB521301]